MENTISNDNNFSDTQVFNFSINPINENAEISISASIADEHIEFSGFANKRDEIVSGALN